MESLRPCQALLLRRHGRNTPLGEAPPTASEFEVFRVPVVVAGSRRREPEEVAEVVAVAGSQRQEQEAADSQHRVWEEADSRAADSRAGHIPRAGGNRAGGNRAGHSPRGAGNPDWDSRRKDQPWLTVPGARGRRSFPARG